jgi:tRNA1Val (adenine37-N6)-methyltransferase
MKVNTDGVLLGAAMTILPGDGRLLDVGTGTGTIALMAAQRLVGEICSQAGAVMIDAVDIDEPSATEAAMNFCQSPWSANLCAYNKSLDQFAAESEAMYDLIFSNPPYFEDSLTAPDERKSAARHTCDGLSYRDIFEFAKVRLNGSGRVAFVLPADQEAALCRYGRMCGLHLFHVLRIRTVPRKAPSRIVAEFSFGRCESVREEILTIQNEGQYTQEYLSLTKDCYLFA